MFAIYCDVIILGKWEPLLSPKHLFVFDASLDMCPVDLALFDGMILDRHIFILIIDISLLPDRQRDIRVTIHSI